MDLRDLEHNTRDGLHIASLAGTWLAIVAGFGGMRDHEGKLSLHPQRPPGWASYEFRLRWRGSRFKVHVGDEVTYELVDGDPDVEFTEGGELVRLTAGKPVTRPLQQVDPLTPRPEQPPGRKPISSEDMRVAITE